jgi:hypothetical protein
MNFDPRFSPRKSPSEGLTPPLHCVERGLRGEDERNIAA